MRAVVKMAIFIAYITAICDAEYRDEFEIDDQTWRDLEQTLNEWLFLNSEAVQIIQAPVIPQSAASSAKDLRLEDWFRQLELAASQQGSVVSWFSFFFSPAVWHDNNRWLLIHSGTSSCIQTAFFAL